MSAFDWLSAKISGAEGATAGYPLDRPRITDENFKRLKLSSNR